MCYFILQIECRMHVRIFARMHRHEWEGAHIQMIWCADESFNPSDQYTRRYDHSHRRRDARRNNRARHFWDNFIRKKSFLITRRFSTLLQTLVFYLVMYITSYSIRIVLLPRYVNIYDTMAPMSLIVQIYSDYAFIMLSLCFHYAFIMLL